MTSRENQQNQNDFKYRCINEMTGSVSSPLFIDVAWQQQTQ